MMKRLTLMTLSWMLLQKLLLVVWVRKRRMAADLQRMMNLGVFALACVRCENGYSVLPLCPSRG